MSTSDKKKTAILVLLIVVGVAGYIWVYRSGEAPPPADTAKAEAPAVRGVKGKGKPQLKAGQDAQIQLPLLQGIAADNVGRRNIFQYVVPPPPPPKPPERIVYVPQPPPQPPGPPQPPPPPPFPAFRYEGFSKVKDGGKMLGSVTLTGATYPVKEGDCLMGQYCISKLTESLVEIEDLQYKRRQSFTRVQ